MVKEFLEKDGQEGQEEAPAGQEASDGQVAQEASAGLEAQEGQEAQEDQAAQDIQESLEAQVGQVVLEVQEAEPRHHPRRTARGPQWQQPAGHHETQV